MTVELLEKLDIAVGTALPSHLWNLTLKWFLTRVRTFSDRSINGEAAAMFFLALYVSFMGTELQQLRCFPLPSSSA